MLAQNATTTMFSHDTDGKGCVLKLGNTGLIFIDPGLKFDETYYCDLLLPQQLLSAKYQVPVEFIFHQESASAHNTW